MPEILVVGGGIGGLTFGVAARRLGIGVSIIERSASVAIGAAGIGLHLNAQLALHQIGMADRVAAVATKLDGYHLLDALEREIGYAPYEEVWGSPTWAVHRADLNAVLRSGLRDDQVVLGLAVVDLRADGDQVVVTFADGSARHYELVVGADGVRSIVRAAVVGPGLARYAGACFWRTTLPEQIVWRASGFVRDALTVGLIPLPGNRTHASFQMRVEEPPAEFGLRACRACTRVLLGSRADCGSSPRAAAGQ